MRELPRIPPENNDDPAPAGYILKRLPSSESDSKGLSLFLSTPHADQYRQWMVKRALLAEKARERKLARNRDRQYKREAQKNAESHSTGNTPSLPSLRSRSSKLCPEEERLKLQRKMEQDLDLPSQGLVPAYAWDEPLKLLATNQSPDKDAHNRNAEIFQQLAEQGHLRKVGLGKESLDLAVRALAQLRDEMPHFKAVIDFILNQLEFSRLRDVPWHVPPVLLHGEPGIGKTYFSQQLANILQVPLQRIAFDSSVTSSRLLGSDKHWGNTTYGMVFKEVVMGQCASPIFLLDEIDKAGAHRDQSALAPLHSLLEPVSSAAVTDISVDFTFNASHVIWIATANDPRKVPDSLKSRVRIFYVEVPTGREALLAARTVAYKVYERMGASLADPPPEAVIRRLAHLTARQIAQAMEQAYVAAITQKRRSIALTDFSVQTLFDDEGSSEGVCCASQAVGGGTLH